MTNSSELHTKILELEIKIANLRIISLEQKIEELQAKIANLEEGKKTELSFRTAAYNPKGVTDARGTRTNTDSDNTR